MCFSLPQSKALQVDTSANFSVWQWLRHCENLQSVSVQIRGNPKVNLRLNSWIATQIFAKFARNDGETLSFWALAKNPKKFKTHFKFMDTSLSCESSVWQCKEFLDISRYRSVWQCKERSVWQGKIRQVSMTKSYAILLKQNLHFA